MQESGTLELRGFYSDKNGMVKGLIILYLSFFTLSEECMQKAFKEVLGEKYSFSRLKFVPGKKLKFWVKENKRNSVIERVILPLPIDEDLERVAKIISGGKSHEEVYAKIKAAALSRGQIDLEELLPESVRFLNNKKNPYCNGANCWNASHLWEEDYLKIEKYNPVQFYKKLERNYIELKEGEEIRFGDKILVEQKQLGLIHSARYIDDSIVWHKSGMSNEAPYHFETVEGMMDSYYPKKGGVIRIFREKRKYD